jgi:hypothetical protein
MPSGGRSITLSLQKALFQQVNPRIFVEISKDQTTLTAQGITEKDFPNLRFVTNNITNIEGYMYLKDFLVYLENDNYPTQIYGLNDIVNTRMVNNDAIAYLNGDRSHQPFKDGFQDGIVIGTLIDTLSKLSRYTPDTSNIPKTFTMVLDPSPSVAPAPAAQVNDAGAPEASVPNFGGTV